MDNKMEKDVFLGFYRNSVKHLSKKAKNIFANSYSLMDLFKLIKMDLNRLQTLRSILISMTWIGF